MAIGSDALSDAATACLQKMRMANVNDACIRTFLAQHARVSSGETGTIAEGELMPVGSIDALDDIRLPCRPELLNKTVVMKLNGGLGTSMGLHKAKLLLPIKNNKTFLDFTALQMSKVRSGDSGGQPRFLLLNSFNTAADTKEYLKRYPELYTAFDSQVHLMQNQVPKILVDTLFPVEWSAADGSRDCEWAPPGHGDCYTALYSQGKLQDLINAGYQYLFVSNGDNLGATLDPRIVAYMEEHKLDFLIEVCHRTASDRKGGHLARRLVETVDPVTHEKHQDGKLVLRESAQCSKEDEEHFQDIQRHRYFNTNNIWVNLASLKEIMDRHDGILPLPVMRNVKHVVPTDVSSPMIYQLETAMGSAIAVFKRAAAVVVPRERFAPVKTCADLLVLRSDAYTTTEDSRLVLDERCHGQPPAVDLDGLYYKYIDDFENLVEAGVPSLVECQRLTIRGPVRFAAGVVIRGDVTIINDNSAVPLQLKDGQVLDNVTVYA